MADGRAFCVRWGASPPNPTIVVTGTQEAIALVAEFMAVGLDEIVITMIDVGPGRVLAFDPSQPKRAVGISPRELTSDSSLWRCISD